MAISDPELRQQLPAPGRLDTQCAPYFIIDPKVALPASLYLSGNIHAGWPDVGGDNWKGVLGDRTLQLGARSPASRADAVRAEAFELALRNAGATLPRRDSVDARIVSKYATARARSSMTRGRWAVGPSMPPVNLRCTPRATASRMNGRRCTRSLWTIRMSLIR